MVPGKVDIGLTAELEVDVSCSVGQALMSVERAESRHHSDVRGHLGF